MKTLTMKLSAETFAWLEKEAKRVNRPKSVLVRELLERAQQHQLPGRRSALDLAGDLCGSVESGLGDLSHNKKHLKGFGR